MSNTLESVFSMATTGMSAQSVRMNTIASNLANAGNVGPSEDKTYHKKYPIFSEITQQLSAANPEAMPVGGVQVSSIQQSKKPLDKHYEPNNPNANQDGFVYVSDVNPIEEMTNMIAASKEYEANVDVMSTTKNLVLQSINLISK